MRCNRTRPASARGVLAWTGRVSSKAIRGGRSGAVGLRYALDLWALHVTADLWLREIKVLVE
eukprot:3936321-Rhodomonas_salina.4